VRMIITQKKLGRMHRKQKNHNVSQRSGFGNVGIRKLVGILNSRKRVGNVTLSRSMSKMKSPQRNRRSQKMPRLLRRWIKGNLEGWCSRILGTMGKRKIEVGSRIGRGQGLLRENGTVR
jgi:hypothetical protein